MRSRCLPGTTCRTFWDEATLDEATPGGASRVIRHGGKQITSHTVPCRNTCECPCHTVHREFMRGQR